MGTTKLLYGLSIIAYFIFSLSLFPIWGANVVFPMFILVGLGGWLFGSTRGLMILIPILIFHYFLFSEIYADIAIYYESRVFGTLLAIIVILLGNVLRKNHEAIKETNVKLDTLVNERKNELNALAEKLIGNAENMRSDLGQELHDGIGQYLTGIRLYCSSLTEQLKSDMDPLSDLANTLITKAENTHNMVRRTARTLFPVKINESGLFSALNELASCFEDTYEIQLSIDVFDTLTDLPERTALQLYRISQETALHLLTNLHADHIHLKLVTSENNFQLLISHNGTPMDLYVKPNVETRLIGYRLKEISGSFRVDFSSSTLEKFSFQIPREKTVGPTC